MDVRLYVSFNISRGIVTFGGANNKNLRGFCNDIDLKKRRQSWELPTEVKTMKVGTSSSERRSVTLIG